MDCHEDFHIAKLPPPQVDADRAEVHLRKPVKGDLEARFSTHPLHALKEEGVEIRDI